MNSLFIKKWLQENKWLVFILSISLVLCLFYSFYFQIKPVVDARAYDDIAWNIVSGNDYKEVADKTFENDFALGRTGPLYQYFLAVIYWLFGHSYAAVWIIQALLHVFSAFLIYLTVLLIFKENEFRKKIGLWAVAIFAFYPDLIEISAMLMTETLYLFLFCLMLFLFFKYINSPNKLLLVGLGVVSGLAVLARPPVLFLLPVILFYFYKKKLWKSAGIFIFILFLIFTPWTTRNYLIYEKIMPFGVVGQYNFWIGNHIGANGEQEPSQEIFNFISTHEIQELGDESMKQFESYVWEYPGEFLKLSMLRVNKYFSVLRPMGFWFYTSGWKQWLFVVLSAIWSILLFVGGLGGIIKLFKRRSEAINYLLLFALLTPLILFITVVETRYRFQIYPLLIIFAAYFINSFGANKNIWFKTLLLASTVIFTNGLVDGLVNFNQFKDKLLGHF